MVERGHPVAVREPVELVLPLLDGVAQPADQQHVGPMAHLVDVDLELPGSVCRDGHGCRLTGGDLGAAGDGGLDAVDRRPVEQLAAAVDRVGRAVAGVDAIVSAPVPPVIT